jgi:hypothetical protein
VYEFSQSGANQEYGNSVGYWWAAVEKENWPQDKEYQKLIKEKLVI